MKRLIYVTILAFGTAAFAADQSVIDYLITDITRNNATILGALGYEKEASEIEGDGTAYEEEEAELAD